YPERWYPVISNLIGHNQRVVHRAAAHCMVSFLSETFAGEKYKKDIAQKLAPWMTDPNWADADGRYRFLPSLDNVQAPELLSGWIWILEHGEDKIEGESEYDRFQAVEALARYGDRSAIPALRRELEKVRYEPGRGIIIRALAKCGGFSDDEMADA